MICRWFPVQREANDVSRAADKAGSSIDARMAMMAMTTV